MRDRVAPVERTVAGAFRYELVGEDGEELGDLTSEKNTWEVGVDRLTLLNGIP